MINPLLRRNELRGVLVFVGLCEVDGDFYECEREGRRGPQDFHFAERSGVVGRLGSSSRGPPRRSEKPRPSAHLVLPHQSAAFGQKKAGPALTDASESSTEK